MIFIQVILFHTYFMEITPFIPVCLQINNYGSVKLLKNVSKSSFFGNFELPVWAFQNKLKSDF